jgi:hypothetical protein
MLRLAYLMPDFWLEVSLYLEMSCDRPTQSGFSVVFLGPRANAEFVPKLHVALHASQAHPVVTLRISPSINVTLTSGWTNQFMGDMGEGTWPSRLGESQMRQQCMVMGPA